MFVFVLAIWQFLLHHLASPFSFFSLLLKMLRLYSLRLWPAGKQNGFFFQPHLFLIFLNAFHCITNWLPMTLYIIKWIPFVEIVPLEEFKNSYSSCSSSFYNWWFKEKNKERLNFWGVWIFTSTHPLIYPPPHTETRTEIYITYTYVLVVLYIQWEHFEKYQHHLSG